MNKKRKCLICCTLHQTEHYGLCENCFKQAAIQTVEEVEKRQRK